MSQPARGLSGTLRLPCRSLVLVPTSRVLDRERRKHHVTSSLVEVVALDEALVLRRGRPVLRKGVALPRAGTSLPVDEPAVPAAGRPVPLLRGDERSNQVRRSLVDPAMIRVDLPGRSLRCTPADLGMVKPRSRMPMLSWEIPTTFGEDSGSFEITRFEGRQTGLPPSRTSVALTAAGRARPGRPRRSRS